MLWKGLTFEKTSTPTHNPYNLSPAIIFQLNLFSIVFNATDVLNELDTKHN